MKYKIKNEKGITMVALVITVLILLILTNMLVYNAQDNIYIRAVTNLYNDIDILREKVSEYYNEYGKIPAEIKYTNEEQLQNLSSVLSTQNDTGDFYVIDLEAMQGITLNYGKDYEKVKGDKNNANIYTDLYIINKNSHNIFYVEGINIKENGITKTYYTDYIEPDQTSIDLRYIDGILIPDGYYYIGKTKDSSGNESIVISNIQGETVDTNKTNQYIWTKQISEIEAAPGSITLDSNQEEYQFVKSVNTYKGYFKNKEGKVQYVIIDEEKWSEKYTKDMEYEDRNGDKLTIPEGFRISMSPTMNTVENGFVVKDSNENEWVWVVVPNSVFTTATNNSDYDNIKADLIEYAKDYRNGSSTQDFNWNDEWYDGCGIVDSKTYTEMYNKMLSSVYTNNGFWISRYEIGDSTATKNNTTRTSNSGTSGKAVSQQNQIPYNYVTCSEAQTLASGMSTDSNKTSSLLFGIQWDLVCKFLEENSNLTYDDIATDSTSWGNYANSGLTLVRGKYNINPTSSTSSWTLFTTDTTNYVVSSKTSSDIKYFQLLTTGTSEQTRRLNIYDFAGNVHEWTLEYANYRSTKPCTYRGGNYSITGTATYRYFDTISNVYERVGFRTTFY